MMKVYGRPNHTEVDHETNQIANPYPLRSRQRLFAAFQIANFVHNAVVGSYN
jgi:hypothetical protein